jgi:hypothetical protein
MKHLTALCFAFLLFALGFGVIVVNRHALTTAIMTFAGGLMLVALALAIPVQLGEAKATLVELGVSLRDVFTRPPSGGSS